MTAPRVIAFAGPSLRTAALPGVELRPPAAAGDLLALLPLQPCTVALIDGVFDQQASVQHKEILALMARGFRVFGGSSMGALRAAELRVYGMEGVGAIYAAYAAGRIVADDEVAVLHAPAALGYLPLTEALVDVRATLVAAVRQHIVTVAAARALRASAVARFWRERTWPGIIDDARGAIGETAVRRFSGWLPAGKVSLKAIDARHCLAAALSADSRPRMPTEPPPLTSFFRDLARQCAVVL